MIQFLGQLGLHCHLFDSNLAIITLVREDRKMSLNIGDKIPEFELFNYDKTKHSDKDFLGQKTMFVFMPFPYSSVCDKEICELRD